ncbi:hypothetical protein C1645_838100 [Glomus cerebriforme]|uniref:DDE Tnp4 domain-containing protein n=1 Tax=Glomus cerebriforme TaxID=658196 RepID=A0A397S7L5_9GLOM|nr:hypothetical protein C1645_838100 [Glomus cerebriforme]
MNRKWQIHRILLLQTFLENESEEEEEETSSKEEETKSKYWWQHVLPFYDPVRMKPQACVEFQLAIFLCQLSSTESIFKHCLKFEPTLEKHKKVHEKFENLGGLKNVIRAVDGTYIPMKNAPSKNLKVYFTQKKCYAIHCQGIKFFFL